AHQFPAVEHRTRIGSAPELTAPAVSLPLTHNPQLLQAIDGFHDGEFACPNHTRRQERLQRLERATDSVSDAGGTKAASLTVVAENLSKVCGKNRGAKARLVSPPVVVINLAFLHIPIFFVKPHVFERRPRLDMRLITV